MERDPDLVNPGWERPKDWKYEADWDSPAWKRFRENQDAKIAELRERYGFQKCPACGVVHTGKTLFCRGCSYKADVPPEDKNKVARLRKLDELAAQAQELGMGYQEGEIHKAADQQSNLASKAKNEGAAPSGLAKFMSPEFDSRTAGFQPARSGA